MVPTLILKSSFGGGGLCWVLFFWWFIGKSVLTLRSGFEGGLKEIMKKDNFLKKLTENRFEGFLPN